MGSYKTQQDTTILGSTHKKRQTSLSNMSDFFSIFVFRERIFTQAITLMDK